MSNSTYAEIFEDAYPEQFFEMYIAEQNMVGAGLGLATRGKIPFVSTFAAFFSRAFDQVRMSQYTEPNLSFAGPTPGSPSAKTGRPRWAWRTWPCSGPSGTAWSFIR